jgi:hypothetical protein
MKLPRRTFLHLAAGAAALPVVPPAAALGQGTIIPTSALPAKADLRSGR